MTFLKSMGFSVLFIVGSTFILAGLGFDSPEAFSLNWWFFLLGQLMILNFFIYLAVYARGNRNER